MARIVKPKAVTAKVYAHFAVITVLVTGSIGIFADGESREMIAKEVANASISVDAPAEKDRFRFTQQRESHGWGQDSGSESDDEGSYDDSGGFAATANGMPRMAGINNQLGKAVVKRKRRGPPIPGLEKNQEAPRQASEQKQPGAEQLEQMLSASRARSGGDLSDEF